jgi:pimeloyl-ACP methyl ester carboxylesterase
MPRVQINGVSIAYEIFGQGPPVVWTPGGWFPRIGRAYLDAGRLSASSRVLIWDRRNIGASDVAIEDVPSEYYLWADDLHHLLQALGLSPAYLGGWSAGSVLSLLMAHRYPEDVRGLILVDIPWDKPTAGSPIVDALCFQLAAVAESQGMQAVIALSTEAWSRIPSQDYDFLLGWVADTISMNPGNRARLLALDPKQFAAIMRKWGNWALSERFYLAGLSDDQIRRISAPALIAHGINERHPRHTAEELYRLLPNAEWVEYTERCTPEEIEHATGREKDILMMPFIEEFLQRIESGQFGTMRQ